MNSKMNLHLRLSALLLGLVMLSAAVPALASDPVRIRTTELGASLRAEPSADSRKLDSVHQYTELDVLGMRNGWYYVYYNGQYGYVNPGTKYVTVIAWGSSPSDTSSAGRNTGSGTWIRTTELGASLRSGPSVDSAKLASIHQFTELEVLGTRNGWYYVYYNGQYGYVNPGSKYVTVIASGSGSSGSGSSAGGHQGDSGHYGGAAPYDIGIPYVGSTVYPEGAMNLTVFWVQVQLKQTGIWYQGYEWDETGHLGDHTISEIADFMHARGYYGHMGLVDQDVIDELASYLGSRVEPVYAGGFYEAMDSIMIGGPEGSMNIIYSNLYNGGTTPYVTLGARWIQVCLKRLGYYTGSVDGRYGEGTEQAVKRFQRDYGFQERQYVTLGVARKMLENYYYSGGSLNALP